MLENLINVAYIIGRSFGILLLSALGLAIIFGMMDIINLAHGEFLMVGAYTTVLSFHAGTPLGIAMILGGVTTAIFGLIVEVAIIRHLYGRLIDSMVATWGISLILSQMALIIFGPSLPNIRTPLGSVKYGGFTGSLYDIFLPFISLVFVIAIYMILYNTRIGMQARATMQNEEMARSLGVNTSRIYAITFVFGSFVAGLTGGLFAPIVSIVPTLGAGFIVESFVTVIVGGSNILVGIPLSAFSLSFVRGGAASLGDTLTGRIALLVTAIVLIRILPEGIASIWEEDA
jgi:branched-chain amino acid transport system permease protein